MTTIQKRFDLDAALNALSIQPHTLNVNRYQQSEHAPIHLIYKAQFDVKVTSLDGLGAKAHDLFVEMYEQGLEVERFEISNGRFNWIDTGAIDSHNRFNPTGTVEYKCTLAVTFKTRDQIAAKNEREQEHINGIVDYFRERRFGKAAEGEIVDGPAEITEG